MEIKIVKNINKKLEEINWNKIQMEREEIVFKKNEVSKRLISK